MKTAFTKSFAKDLGRHAKDKNLLARIREIILDVEAADSITRHQQSEKAESGRIIFPHQIR